MTSYMLKLKGQNIDQLLLYYRYFHMLCGGWVFKKCFKTTEKGSFKKGKMKDEHFDVAQTRKCAECGSDEEMR